MAVAPEIILVLTALIVLAVDLGVMREEPLRNRFWVCSAFATTGCLVAGAWLIFFNRPLPAEGDAVTVLTGMFIDDPLTRLVKIALLFLSVSTIIISLESKFTRHVGEYLALILMSTTGMMLLVGSTDLLMIFVSLELTSLSLYILTAFNSQNLRSVEAALKYFLFGGMATAFTLFGISLIYGMSGSTNLSAIASNLAANDHTLDPLLIVALVMTVIGFGFKVAAVPFHLWAPDAYQGAPTPSAALIASGSKLASFFVLARLLLVSFADAKGNGAWHHFAAGWMPLLAILAAASMALGNLAAIVQSDVKRLLAYSAIAHSGYALLGIIAGNQPGVSALIFYMITYGLTVVGAFGVAQVVESISGSSQLAGFAGLSRRDPLLSLCMMIFMLSLAGIPPLAGFFGKFYLFTSVIAGGRNLGLLWLVIFAIATSAISLYYYLQVLKQIYIAPPSPHEQKLCAPLSSKIIICLLAIGVIIFGCLPGLLIDPISAAMQSFGL